MRRVVPSRIEAPSGPERHRLVAPAAHDINERREQSRLPQPMPRVEPRPEPVRQVPAPLEPSACSRAAVARPPRARAGCCAAPRTRPVLVSAFGGARRGSARVPAFIQPRAEVQPACPASNPAQLVPREACTGSHHQWCHVARPVTMAVGCVTCCAMPAPSRPAISRRSNRQASSQALPRRSPAHRPEGARQKPGAIIRPARPTSSRAASIR